MQYCTRGSCLCTYVINGFLHRHCICSILLTSSLHARHSSLQHAKPSCNRLKILTLLRHRCSCECRECLCLHSVAQMQCSKQVLDLQSGRDTRACHCRLCLSGTSACWTDGLASCCSWQRRWLRVRSAPWTIRLATGGALQSLRLRITSAFWTNRLPCCGAWRRSGFWQLPLRRATRISCFCQL